MIKNLTPRYLNEHTTALGAAFAVHLALVAWMVALPSLPASIQPQVIRISMVAPSAQPQELVQPKPVETPMIVAPPTTAPVKVERKVEKKNQQEEKKEEQVQQASSVPTSGLQSPEATEKVAARTDPVFDAAYLHNPPPVYPPPARRGGVQGKVTLEVEVTPQGSARDVEVARSSGSSMLDDAARDAVRQWRFVPAKRGEELVEAKVIVPVEFKLN